MTDKSDEPASKRSRPGDIMALTAAEFIIRRKAALQTKIDENTDRVRRCIAEATRTASQNAFGGADFRVFLGDIDRFDEIAIRHWVVDELGYARVDLKSGRGWMEIFLPAE